MCEHTYLLLNHFSMEQVDEQFSLCALQEFLVFKLIYQRRIQNISSKNRFLTFTHQRTYFFQSFIFILFFSSDGEN